MRILVLDDQGLAEREHIFRAAFPTSPTLYLTIWTKFPPDFEYFDMFDVISWDNDLGDGSDVIERLKSLLWVLPNRFEKHFSHQYHIVHSANPAAAERLVQLFRDIGAQADQCSILNYHPRL